LSCQTGTIGPNVRFPEDREPFHAHHSVRTHRTEEVETAPLELDHDLTRRDAWMFTPLLAIMIALPIMISALFAFSAWHIANRDEASLSVRRRRLPCGGRISRCRCCDSLKAEASGRHPAECAVERRATAQSLRPAG
jgi:hypothetical protein